MNFILKSILNDSVTEINPTIVYNEGWMVRLLVHYSIKKEIKIGELDFGKMENWTSEGTITSPFSSAPKHKEGNTHADIAIGDFTVDYDKDSQITINDDGKVFGIIESKMRNNLGQSVSNFKNYNQASRNVSCIAKNITSIKNYSSVNSKLKSYFILVAPEKTMEKYEIEKQLSKELIMNQIDKRFNAYGDDFKASENFFYIIREAQKMTIATITYEEWIGKFEGHKEKDELNDFYNNCLKYNHV